VKGAMNVKERKIAMNLRFIGVIKKNMAEILEFPEDFKAIYVCPMCGYVVKDETPDVCPLCNAPGESFEKFELLG
jgi:rubrerythrin